MEAEVVDLETVPVPRRPRSRAWVAAVAAVAVTGATAFAFVAMNHDEKSPNTVLAEAASRTVSARSAHVSISAALHVGAQSIAIVAGESAVDFSTKASTLTLRTGAVDERIRVVRGVSYLSVPSVSLPRGAHWVAITAADVDADPNTGAALDARDPDTGLTLLSAIKGSASVAGTQTLDGVRVTDYAFMLDLKRLFDRADAGATALEASSLGKSIKGFAALADASSIPAEAWIDAAGRVRKFVVTVTVTNRQQTTKVVGEFRYSHFDEPVDVEPPPASDTISFRDDPSLFFRIAAAGKVPQ